jgi:predicted transcriptional regulator
MVKVTFSLDDATVARIRKTAARLGAPQSQVVRDAVADYAARKDRLSEAERLRMLAVVDRLLEAVPSRPQSEVDAEIRSLCGF